MGFKELESKVRDLANKIKGTPNSSNAASAANSPVSDSPGSACSSTSEGSCAATESESKDESNACKEGTC